MKIGVFDSGIGGLTVLKSIVKKYPNNEYIYFGDTLNIPYGSKTIKQLEILVDKIIKFLIKEDIDLIIIACGTVSANLYSKIKNKYNIKIIDVVSPTIKYLNNSKYDNIGVIGTEMTIKSNLFNNLINKNIYSKACPMLVPFIENNNIESKEFYNYLDEYLIDFKTKIEVLVLGCTHYPLLKDKINEYLKEEIVLLDMGKILSNHLDIPNNDTNKITLFFSKIDDILIKNVKLIIGDYKIINKKLD